MRRQLRFYSSAALYAVDLSALTRVEVGRIQSTDDPLYRYEIPAVWFRRRRGIDTSNVGFLWGVSRNRHAERDGASARAFLEKTLCDGRYGPTCQIRWDGEHLWSAPSLDFKSVRTDAEFLQNMLLNYPQIPEGYNGWWRF